MKELKKYRLENFARFDSKEDLPKPNTNFLSDGCNNDCNMQKNDNEKLLEQYCHATNRNYLQIYSSDNLKNELANIIKEPNKVKHVIF